MKTYRKDEIVNKHGQYIAYYSLAPGNTELEKFKNSPLINSIAYTEHILEDDNGDRLTCMVTTKKYKGYHSLTCFNSLGETIFNEEQACQKNSIEEVEQCLADNDLIT